MCLFNFNVPQIAEKYFFYLYGRPKKDLNCYQNNLIFDMTTGRKQCVIGMEIVNKMFKSI